MIIKQAVVRVGCKSRRMFVIYAPDMSAYKLEAIYAYAVGMRLYSNAYC